MHAAKICFTDEQMGALKYFFENFQFFRLAVTASHNTEKNIDRGFIDIVGACLLGRICEIAKWAEFDRLFILFEASDRIERKVLTSLSGKKIRRKAKEIQIELGVMPKSSCMPALEIADFIVHTVGAQTRNRNEEAGRVRRDFESIFRNVDERLTSFMEITKVRNSGNS